MELLVVLFPVQHPLRHNNPPPPVYYEIILKSEDRQLVASTVNGAGIVSFKDLFLQFLPLRLTHLNKWVNNDALVNTIFIKLKPY